MAVSGDPVRAGYVASLARPGGNVTGLSFVSPDVSAKLLEILKETVPNASRVAVIWNGANAVKRLDFEETQRAARALGVAVHSAEFKTPGRLDASFASITRARPQALLILVDEVVNQPDVFVPIEDFAMKHRLPSISAERRHTEAGGLLSYGPSTAALFRRAATYVDNILKGAKPADLPIEQPAKFEMVLNLKTAKALGITMPRSLLLRADRVID
jgi:putative ABC transport system substrate-binding protein